MVEKDVRFEILGPVRVTARDREITITAGRERSCLAMLLLHPDQPVPAADLIDALWGEHPPKNARGQLQGCVSRLRKQLTASGNTGTIINTEPEGYRLRTNAAVIDRLEFQALIIKARAATATGQHTQACDDYRTALGLWRGTALAGIDRSAVRRRALVLDEERARALEECIEVELELGAAGELIGELTDLIHQHPYRERLHAALMLVLYRADRQADALAAYQRIRDTLVAELGQEPGPALRRLHQRVLAGDEALRPAATEPVRADASLAPTHCLPRTLADFTGRETELAWLIKAEQADPYAPLILAIDGMPGVGKTSLAVRAGHLLTSRCPDGQVFIDLHGHSEHRPVDPAAALDTLLRQLGIPATHIPTDLEERISLWRTELASRRVLIVLDNAASSSQVTPLLPTTAGCLALVTSRRRLVDLEGASPRSLDTLTSAESVALLERLAGPRIHYEAAAAAEVAQRCGNLPLALRLAGARLAHRPHWRVQDLADRLARSQAPLAELAIRDRTVSEAFFLSYSHLAHAGQRMFRLLGLHPGEHFDTHTAAALTGLSLYEAQQLLDELVDCHLVQEDHPDRCRLHDLLKEYAAQLAKTEPEHLRTAAIEQMLDYYLHASAIACDRMETPASRRTLRTGEPSRPDLLEGHAQRANEWLAGNQHNLVAAVHCAERLGLDRYAWRLARAMWQFLHTHGHLDDVVSTHRSGLASAERLGEGEAVATMCNYLAAARFRTGYYQQAVELVQRTLRHRRHIGDTAGEAVVRTNLATVYTEWGKHREAAAECERALATARRSSDTAVLASVVSNVGANYLTLGHYNLALRYSRRGLALAREVGYERLSATVLENIGVTRARLGEFTAALRLLKASLSARQRIRDRHGIGVTLNELGAVHRALGNLDVAAAHHRQALVIMQEAGFRQGECAVYNQYGQTLRATGDLASALEMHQRALAGATTIRHKYGEARALDGIAACLQDTDPAAAHRHWLQARQLYLELDVPERDQVERHLAALATRMAGLVDAPQRPSPARREGPAPTPTTFPGCGGSVTGEPGPYSRI